MGSYKNKQGGKSFFADDVVALIKNSGG